MKEYSFLAEADVYVGGDNFWKDAYQAAKFGVESGKDAVKNAANSVKKNLKIDKFAKNYPKTYKGLNIAAAAGSAGYSYYLAIMNGLMAKKVTSLIHDLEDPAIDTRTKAVALFINLGYVKDDLIDIGNVKSVSVSYEDALKIFNSLSDKEKWLVCPRRGIYVNAKKFLLYRHVIKDKGFIDLYPYNNNDKIGFVILAVSPKWRGKGVTQELVKQCIEDCPKLNIKKIWWRCDRVNVASYKSALKNGFKLSSQSKNYYSLYKDIK